MARVVVFSVAGLLVALSSARGQFAFDGFDPNVIDGDPNANGTVRVVVIQPDGKILLGGEFTALAPNGGPTVTRNRIARLNPDGTLDAAFDPNANNIVYSLAVQADGKILAGGVFSSIGGQPRRNIARLDPTTGLADSFDPNMGPGDPVGNGVKSIAVQADGKILVGGFFTSIGGQTRNHIARLDATTGLVDSFDPNASGFVVESIVVQRDGKILVGGVFTSIGGQTRNNIARLDPTTSLADSFNPNADRGVVTIAVQPDGRILVGGIFTSIGGQTRSRIARLDATSGLADSFDPNAIGSVYAIVVQVDGKILTAGPFTSIGGQTRHSIARLDATTGLADSFDPNSPDVSNSVLTIAVQADGKILAGGSFRTLAPNGGGTVTRNYIARLETDGRVDQTLNLNFDAGRFVLATVVQPDGKILIGGGFSTVLGVTRNNIARLNTDGTLDLAFDPNASNQVSAIALQADGKILVGGLFNSIGGQPRSGMARLDGTTGLADSFDPEVNPPFPLGSGVFSIAVQADGKVLVGGYFTSVSGQPRNHLARLDATTGLADSFNPNPNNGVSAIAVQAGGRILVGGDFTSIGGEARNRIARLNATDGLADSFNPNANSYVSSIVVQGDGKILVGGNFNEFNGPNPIGGQTRNHIARLDATTGLADSFNPNANGTVLSIAVQADGKVVAGGQFLGVNSIGGQTRNCIARLDATTGLADSFDPNADDAVSAMVVQADGKILAGGSFDTIGGEPRKSTVRLSNDTAALQNLAVTKTTIIWVRGGSSPRLRRVIFEYSSDNLTYTPLGEGTAAGSDWILTGLNFSTEVNFYIRARGYYGSGDGSESIIESVRNVFLKPAAQATNLSTRMRVQTGDNVGIGGFIITGTVRKHVLLRAIGPSLTSIGIPGVLADPVLELHGSSGFVTTVNDNWQDDPVQAALIEATGLAPSDDLESAIEARLFPGEYTAVIRGQNNTSGVALVEVYDLNQGVASRLTNVSTRAFVSSGDNIVIAGFILGNHDGDGSIVVRGIGPSLTALGVPDALADPTLELRDGNGVLLRSNNDWQDDPVDAAQLTAADLAPTNQLEAGIAMTLPPGPYTALLAGLNNGTGVGLVEVYDRDAP